MNSEAQEKSQQSRVGEVNGVEYWAFAEKETPREIIDALVEIKKPKVVILEGLGDRAGLSELAQVIEDQHVLHVLIIGDDGLELVKSLLDVGFTHFTELETSTPARLVETMYHLTEPGDAAVYFAGTVGDGNDSLAHEYREAVVHLGERFDAS